VQHIDLAPTILDAAEVEIPGEIEVTWLHRTGRMPTAERLMEGTSLVPYLKGERDEPIYSFLVTEECTRMKKWALRTDIYKFILAREQDYLGNPTRELYDLQEDPDEMNNIYEEHRDVGDELEQVLESWIQDMMVRNGLTVDPLIATELTLGKEWVKRAGEQIYW
jgi:arylsulfatase A-like enzyme